MYELRSNEKVIGQVDSTHGMTKDEAIMWFGEIYPERENENVLIDGEWYYYDDLEVIVR